MGGQVGCGPVARGSADAEPYQQKTAAPKDGRFLTQSYEPGLRPKSQSVADLIFSAASA